MPVRTTITSNPPSSVAPSYIETSWDAPATVRALTTTRAGGFSAPPFDGFNLAAHVGDEEDSVHRNRQLLQEMLSLPAPPVWLEQTHSIRIVQLTPGDPPTDIVADGSVASDAGVVCAVMTADCLPLFLCNRQGSQVAAVHVGWRGLAGGIVEAAVSAMNGSPVDILAWAGPCISVDHFEIGGEVKQQLGGPDSAYRECAQAGKYYADLPQLTAHRLGAVGVNQYGFSGSCTFDDEEQFFSHRRDQQSGRMASLIWIEN